MRTLALGLLLLLGGCGSGPEASGGVSADEQRQLNDAAAALDANAGDDGDTNAGNSQ